MSKICANIGIFKKKKLKYKELIKKFKFLRLREKFSKTNYKNQNNTSIIIFQLVIMSYKHHIPHASQHYKGVYLYRLSSIEFANINLK